MRKVLITGAAGFIGFHLAKRLLGVDKKVIGLDNMNPYYDVTLKEARLRILKEDKNFHYVMADLADRQTMVELFEREKPEIVINLAAQVGIRYSLVNPNAYVDSNLVGFMNILEGCRHQQVKHLIFASSGSVYGANTRIPFSPHDSAEHPLSIYAATKRANELMAHTYATLYGLPCTGLRFFTVYGPWGRPDMVPFLFAKAIMEDRPIDVYNHGQMKRDFTYIDDIVEGLVRFLGRAPTPDPAWRGDRPDPSSSFAPYRIYNIGNNQPVVLMDFIEILEEHLGRKSKKNFLPVQGGDVPMMCANTDDLMADVGFRPATPIKEGIRRFIAWYREFYEMSERHS